MTVVNKRTDAERVAGLTEWARDPSTPDDEWAPVTASVYRAVLAAGRAEALRRVEAAVRAMDKYGTGEWSDPSNWRVDYLEVLAVIRDTPEEK